MNTVITRPAANERPAHGAHPPRLLGGALTLTAFLGAFLLFQVQPLVGKALLPWYGGSSAAWAVAMFVFQTLLVIGYAFAHLVRRHLHPPLRSAAFIAVAVACLATLPILPGVEWKPSPDDEPMRHMMQVLMVCIGAPFFVLATTGPTVQEWFARAFPGRNPYRLYAVSNLGSLLGLLTYPFVVELLYEVPTQARIWSAGFLAYVVVASGCAWAVRRINDPDMLAGWTPAAAVAPSSPLATGDVLRWFALSAFGSVMLLATTNHVCEDISSTPTLLIAPLAVYLATFIAAFDRPTWYRRMPLALTTVVCTLIVTFITSLSYAQSAVLHLVLLAAVCWACHGELSRRRPAPDRLTAYYLTISLGGAFGVFVGLVAPLVFDRYWEWIGVTAVAFASMTLVILARVPGFEQLGARWRTAVSAVAAAVACAWIVHGHMQSEPLYEIEAVRSLYGVVYVNGVFHVESGDLCGREMQSGTTRHGLQINTDALRRVPTTYYGGASGVGLALADACRTHEQLRIGVVGLGAGTLAAYGRSGDVYRFYEINPDVVRMAREHFTFLGDSPATMDVVVGDARLTLERESPQAYDLLVVDAFSGDAVPTHLLTAEAFDVYLRHLADDGTLALHLSNRHLDLAPLIRSQARRLVLQGVVVYGASSEDPLERASRWALLSRSSAAAERWFNDNRKAVPLARFPIATLWTDQYSNIFELFQ